MNKWGLTNVFLNLGESKWCKNGAFTTFTFLQHATMDLPHET
jgi:hypothetical protein